MSVKTLFRCKEAVCRSFRRKRAWGGNFIAGIWFLAVNPTRTLFDQILLIILAILLVGGTALAALGIGGIVLTILYSKDITAFHGPMRIAVNLFFPIVLVIGKIFSIDSEKIKFICRGEQ